VWPGPAIVFEDRFFSFLQEKDLSMDPWSRFLAVNMCLPLKGFQLARLCRGLSFFLLGCVRSTILVLPICRDEHLGIDANTSQFRHISRVTVSVRSLARK
jgi:hypothetical protein